MGIVVSEIDFGDGGNEADASTQLGSTAMPPSGTAPAQPQGDGQVGATPPPAQPKADAAAEGAGTAEGAAQEGQESEEGINWATAPEQFRNSYEKNKVLRERAEEEREAYKSELETLRSKQGQGVYLSTDVPLEDFDPYDGLQRMSVEEPEYHDAVVDAVLQAHLWPNIADAVTKMEGKQLGRIEGGVHVFDDDEERLQYQQVQRVWDFLARRTAGVDGPMLSSLIRVVAQNPDIQQAIESRMVGGTQMPQAGQQFAQAGGAGQEPPQTAAMGVQSLQVIANAQGLDLSDPDHVRQATAIQSAQREAVSVRSQMAAELRTRDAQIARMQSELQEVRGGQRQAQTTTTAEAERQAESRVAEHLRGAIDTEYTEKYAGAIPKDRAGLGERLKTLTRERLVADPNYQAANTAAKKWYKQAATASAEQRARYEQKALDAMAVIATLRTNAMAEEAKELLGRLPAQVAAARAKASTAGNRRELPGGSTARTVPPPSPSTPSGDIEATRAAIRRRMKEQGIRMS